MTLTKQLGVPYLRKLVMKLNTHQYRNVYFKNWLLHISLNNESHQTINSFLFNFRLNSIGLTQHWTNKHVKPMKNYLLICKTYLHGRDSTLASKTTFEVKLRPIDEIPTCTRNRPTPINLKGNITVELALWDKYVITALPFCKFASPIFAPKKPYGNSPLLVDFSKNQQVIIRWLHKQQSPCEITNRRKTTHGREKFIFQTLLPPSISLFSNGRPTICGNACSSSC